MMTTDPPVVFTGDTLPAPLNQDALAGGITQLLGWINGFDIPPEPGPAADAAADELSRVRQQCARGAKAIQAHFTPACDAAHKAWKAATALRKSFLDPLQACLDAADRRLVAYDARRRRAAAAAYAATVAAATQQAEERQLQRAIALEASGHAQAAEAALSTPPLVAPPPPPPTAPLSGVSLGVGWDYEVTDPLAIPDEWWMLDHARIRRIVDAQGPEAMRLIPGILVRERTTVRTRR